jgi:hypothetical protein
MSRSSAESRSIYHALLVGIDDYAVKPLRGCVNDVDAIERQLLRAGVPAERIRRLTSPAKSGPTRIPTRPATLANIRAELAELGSELVKPGDRVFIFFSCHGTFGIVGGARGRTFRREVLVPIDFEVDGRYQFLPDYELNEALGKIATRTRSVAVVLDCCYGAGVTREGGWSEMTSRCLDLERDLGSSRRLARDAHAEASDAALARSVDSCLVVAACLNHEESKEDDFDDGVRNGVLTRALTDALARVDEDELARTPWSRIWSSVRAEVAKRNAWQHPWMAGNAARDVLAGPPLDGDAGLGLTEAGAGHYTVDAGTLTGVSIGARIAVYGDQPPVFPALGSAEDSAARRGILLVTSADLSSATARAAEVFQLPGGARGRLVSPGRLVRLRCAVVADGDRSRQRGPDDAARLEAALAASPLLEVVDRRSASVWLERAGNSWFVTDGLHDASEDGALVSLRADDLGCARALLEHYFQYATPLRMAAAAHEVTEPGLREALRLEVLACPHELAPARAQEADLREAPTTGEAAYEIMAGDGICFRVRNHWSQPLRVTLVNSAASGRVQHLGDQAIDPGASFDFWAENALGRPFAMRVPAGRRWCKDRLVAIGTTAMASDLRHLRVEGSFGDIVEARRTRSAERKAADLRDFDTVGSKSMPAERWTAALAVVRTRSR